MSVLVGEAWALLILWSGVLTLVYLEPSEPLIWMPTLDRARYGHRYGGPEPWKADFPEGSAFVCIFGICGLLWCIMLADMRDRLRWDSKLTKKNTLLFMMGLLFASGLSLLITRLLRSIMGEPTPDYISRCLGIHDPDEILSTVSNLHGSPAQLRCTSQISIAEARQGLRSFPSGHSLLGVTAFTFTGMSINKHSLPTASKICTGYILALLGIALCISRVYYHRSHLLDVVFAVVLAAPIACLTVIRYWLIIPGQLSDETYNHELYTLASGDVTQPLKDESNKVDPETNVV
eukprot:Protomagalhaensia_sp_Gyna_25__1287@NODE_1646_length_1663_cov_28_963670_g1345_i0_p1_GENE_NODE_1646_length_1663_cov_28_963670_g1345_i0NODE_1646_length_1663_cov_28_963670_g1345_i0_p1_ORF_typecomplete_len291_score23_68PAP2/PF01569_21/7_2e03PAP2/PF01569_21/1_1e16Glucos_trans_II/PF14264_6/0_033Bax1I/PF01027_20/18Bax1I/PF01027_20/0_086YrhC/PF14143_6/3_4e03YrhC/PF14143_6/0_057ABC_trans_CmpB/PF06541_11/0_099ABC_trans_CmpB/PF06541_11/7_6e02Tad/PF13400_6/3_7e02Tad/PF13400_6/0_92PAP2_3/PF14378_6/5_7e03PAP2_